MKHYAHGGNQVKKAIFSFKVKVKFTKSLTLVSFERWGMHAKYEVSISYGKAGIVPLLDAHLLGNILITRFLQDHGMFHAVAEGWLLLDIGWFVLFMRININALHQRHWIRCTKHKIHTFLLRLEISSFKLKMSFLVWLKNRRGTRFKCNVRL